MKPLRLALLAALLAMPASRPAAQGPAAARRTEMVAMTDGTRLATDIYLPAGEGPFPTLLLRTPYNKQQGTGIGAEGTRRGYAVVVQDTRGRNASEGAGLPFEGEGWWDGRRDGRDTVEWIASLNIAALPVTAAATNFAAAIARLPRSAAMMTRNDGACTAMTPFLRYAANLQRLWNAPQVDDKPKSSESARAGAVEVRRVTCHIFHDR